MIDLKEVDFCVIRQKLLNVIEIVNALLEDFKIIDIDGNKFYYEDVSNKLLT
jgi:hypothetical protein